MSNDDYILSHYKEVAENFGHRAQSSIEDLEIREAEVLFFQETLKSLISNLSEPIKILELGCGNAYTLSVLSQVFPNIQFSAIELSPDLHQLACQRKLKNVEFIKGDMRDEELLTSLGVFDVVLTERSVINLIGKKQQNLAFKLLSQCLKPNGYYLMAESFRESWLNLNQARKEFLLPEIPISKHNLYLTYGSLKYLSQLGLTLSQAPVARHYLSTFFYITRVLHPLLRPEGSQLKSPFFNQFMLNAMPPGCGEFSPIQFCLFQKTS